jgi:hypothetical protein
MVIPQMIASAVLGTATDYIKKNYLNSDAVERGGRYIRSLVAGKSSQPQKKKCSPCAKGKVCRKPKDSTMLKKHKKAKYQIKKKKKKK